MQSLPVMANRPPLSSRNFVSFLTHIKSEGKFLKFFSLPDNRVNEFKELEQLLAQKASEFESSPMYNWRFHNSTNTLFCVKSAVKALWCRAVILQFDECAQRVKVLLIDYGSHEILPACDVRYADQNIASIPTYIVECILADVAPAYGDEWSAEAVKFCEKNLFMQSLSGYIVSVFGNTPVVRLAKPGENEPFVQRLINNGLAKIEVIESKSTSFKFQPLAVGTLHLVSFSSVYSPQLFYVQISAAEVELKNLMASVKSFTDQEKMSFLSAPVIGLPCLAQHNQHYFRAVIREIQQGVGKVLLVDYGIVLTKELQELRVLPSHYLTLPAQAIPCTLKDGHLITQADFLKVTKSERYATLQIVGTQNDIYVVNLLQNGENILAHAKADEALAYSIQPLTLNTVLEVTSSSLFSLQEIYCQIISCKRDLDIIALKLRSANDFEMMQLQDIVPGRPVCAKFSDNLWYRAKIVSALNADNIEVFFVDFGNSDTVKLQDVRTIPSNLMTHSLHAYKLSLYGMDQLPNDPDITDWFEDMILDKALQAEIKQHIQDNEYSVILYLANDKESLNKKVENKLLQAVSVPPKLLNVEILYITHFTSPLSFFGQLTRFDQDSLAKLQEELNLFCSSTQNQHVIKVGDLVSAKFCDDNQYYRAVVESSSDIGHNVVFVDYGNRSFVKSSDVQRLNSKFASHPSFGVECILENCPSSLSSGFLEPYFIDKEIQIHPIQEVTPGKWTVALTDTFAGNMQILQVLKQHSNQSLPENAVKAMPMAKEAVRKSPTVNFPNGNFEPFNHDVISDDGHMKRDPDVEKPRNYKDVDMIPSGSFKEIYVSCVKNPSDFYCQVISDSEELQKLMKKLNEVYNSLKNDMQMKEAKVDAPCCVFHEEDSLWYRAKIKSISGRQGQVFFVDYGNMEVIQLSRAKTLRPEFFSLSPQAIRCSLFNVVSDTGSWNKNNIEAFMSMVSKKSFISQFVKIESNGIHFVNLIDINKLQDDVLSKDLVKLGHVKLQDSNKLLVVTSLVASTSLSYLEQDVSLGSEEVCITYVQDILKFFCQKKKNFAVFRPLMERIQAHYNQQVQTEGIIDRPHTGMTCVAQFSEDSVWYRARVSSVERSTIKVYYVDYGNEEIVPKHKLKYILQDFLSFPAQAIKCQLKGLIQPAMNIPDYFPKIFEGNSLCTFIAKEDDCYAVKLTCDGKDVAHQIATMGLAVSTDSKVEVPAKTPQGNLAPNERASFQRNQLLNVIACYVEDPLKFWCQSEEFKDQLDDLMVKIADFCSNNHGESTKVSIGSYCLAKYTDDSWYRATIKKIDSQQAEIFFIDYGNSETVHISQIRDIVPQLLSLPAQAIECRLHGLPEAYDASLNEKFKEVLENATELMAKMERVDADVLSVSLFDQSDAANEVNILQSIYGIQLDQTASVEQASFVLPNISVGQKSTGFVSSWKSPSNFYIQLTSWDADMEDLHSKISKRYSAETDALQLADVSPGIICCAKYPANEEWYRAKVEDVQQGDYVAVTFVDFGNQSNVLRSNLRVLDGDLLETPLFAVHCYLSEVNPTNGTWCNESMNKFKDFTDDIEIVAEFRDSSAHHAVTIEKDGEVLNVILAGLEEASISSSKVPCLNVQKCRERALTRSRFEGKFSFVESYNTLFITATDWVEDLDSLMSRLKQICEDSESAPCLESVTVGQFCVAKYSCDDTWYRAVVKDVGVDKVTILFVDYGNTETVPFTELRPISSDLSVYPPFAVLCRLNLIPADGKDGEILDRLDTMCVDCVDVAVEVMCDSKPYIVNITTSEGDLVTALVDAGLAVRTVDAKEHSNEVSAAPLEGHALTQERTLVPSKFVARLAFAESAQKIFLTSVEWSGDLDSFMADLCDAYDDPDIESSLLFEKVEVNQQCVAQYDGSWYRAVVKGCEEDEATILFVDYGNSEVRKVSELRALKPEFARYLPFAVECHLDIDPVDGKSHEILSKLEAFVDEAAELEFEILSANKPYVVKMRTPDGDFGSSLIDAGLAIVPEIAATESCDLVEETIESIAESRGLASVYPSMELNSEKVFVTISHVESCEEFYVTPVDCENEFELLKIKISEEYEDTELKSVSLSDLKVEQACAVRYSQDNLWYRGLISAIDNDNIFVSFVDHGNSEMTNVSEIQILTSDLLSFPKFAIRCHFPDFTPNKDMVDGVVSKLQLLVDDLQTVELQILGRINGSLSVKLNADGDFVTQLIDAGLGTRSLSEAEGKSHAIIPELNLEIAEPEETVSPSEFDPGFIDDAAIPADVEQSYQLVENVALAERFAIRKLVSAPTEARLSFVKSWNKFYVAATDWVEEFLLLKENLKMHYTNEDSELAASGITDGQAVVFYSMEREEWCRGVVEEVIDDSAQVHLVDHGDASLIQLSDLRSMASEFLQIPSFVVECKLFDLVPIPGSEPVITDRLRELALLELTFVCTVVSESSPCSIKITTDVDFVTQLIHEGLAESHPDERLHNKETFKDNLQIAFVDEQTDDSLKFTIPLQPITCSEIIGTLQHCEVLNGNLILYVVPCDLVVSLDGFQASLQNEYNGTCGSVTVSEGEYCVAKFPIDGCWYRVQVVNKSEEGIHVKACDYGSNEVVDIVNIRKLSKEFSEVPQFVHECCPSGVRVIKGCEESLEKKVLEFETNWKLIKCQIPSHSTGNTNCLSRIEVMGCDIIEALVEYGLVKKVYPLTNNLEVFQCDIVHVDESVNVYVVPHMLVGEREAVQELLQSVYESKEEDNFFTEISTNLLFAAKKDSTWYRVSVCSLQGDKATVYLVDFGTRYVLSTSSLRLLQEDLCHLSPFCIQCQLHGLLASPSVDLQQKILDVVGDKVATCAVSNYDRSSSCYKVHLLLDNEDILEKVQCAQEPSVQCIEGDYKAVDKSQEMDAESIKGSSNDSKLPENYEEVQCARESSSQHSEVEDFEKEKEYVPMDEDPKDAELVKRESELCLANHDNSFDVEDQDVFESANEIAASNECTNDVGTFLPNDGSGDNLTVSIENDHSQSVPSSEGISSKTDLTHENGDEMSRADEVNENGEGPEAEGKVVDESEVNDEIEAGEDTQSDVKGNEETEANDQTQAYAKSEAAEETKAGDKTEAVTNIEAAEETKAGDKTESYAESEAAEETTAGDKTEAYAKSEAAEETKADDKSEAAEETKADDKTKADTNIEAAEETKVDNKTESYAKSEAAEETKADTNSETDTEADEEREADFKTETVGETNVAIENEAVANQRVLPIGKVDSSVLDLVMENDEIRLAIHVLDTKPEMDQLLKDMQRSYESNDFAKATEGACAVLSEKMWFRGEIIDVDSEPGYARVSFWDYPREEEASVECLRKLDGRFCTTLPYLIWCKIASVKCPDVDAVRNKLLEKLVEESVSVEVLDDVNPQSIRLLDGEALQPFIASNSLVLTVIPSSSFSGEQPAIITHIEESSLSNIHFQLASDAESLRLLRAAMNAEYKEKQEGIAIGDAISTGLYATRIEDSYERCTVLKHDNTTYFYLVDIGMCKELDQTTVLPLRYAFALEPQYAYPSIVPYFSDIPEEKSAEVVSSLQTASDKGLLTVELMSKDENGFHLVDLRVGGLNVLTWLENQNVEVTKTLQIDADID